MEVEEEIQANPNTANPTANRQANRLRGWQHSSRIIRVSRASGGKDRHSKVWTSKGLRDRRVRLSVSTAIQFYDLQDRLGYDQPSKAVEWLINAASDAISELPALDTHAFPDTPPKQLSSTTSDTTSKGSAAAAPTSVPPQNSSFTELLTSGIANNNNGSSSPADDHQQPNYFPARPHSMPMTMSMPLPPPFGIGLISAPAPAPFLAEQQLIPMAAQSQSSADMGGQSFWIGGGGSGAGLNNRGTLQSNSSLFNHNHNHNHNHHLQRFSNSNNSSTIDAAGSIPIFFAAADQHQLSAFDARLQLCYADATRHSDHKGKGKNSL